MENQSKILCEIIEHGINMASSTKKYKDQVNILIMALSAVKSICENTIKEDGK